LLSFKYNIKAFSLAFGNDKPFFSSEFNMLLYFIGSSFTILDILFNAAKSLVSVPNDIASTIFRLFNNFIAPKENPSALATLYIVGSSITKSTPFKSAISAFFHLFTIDVLPLCTKFPLITHIQYCAPDCSFAFCKWYIWPL